MTRNVDDMYKLYSAESLKARATHGRAKIPDNVEERGSKLIEQRSELATETQEQRDKTV